MSGREVRLQPRDTRWMEFIAQQGGVPMSLIGQVEQIGSSQLHEMVKRWKSVGRVLVERVDYGAPGRWRNSKHFDEPGAVPQGPLWVYMTREGAWGYLDFDPGAWWPKPTTVAHLTALTELRLALTGLETDPEVWTSERLLRRRLRTESGQLGAHVHDAWFQDIGDPDKVWAIEVELSRKFGAGRLMAAMARALDAADRHELAGVLYFVRGEALRRAVESTGTRLAHKRGVERLSNLEIHDLDTTLSKKGVR